MTLRVEEIVLDDWASEELWKHGIRPGQIFQMLENRHILLRNKRRRRATHRLVGPDGSGLLLTVCITPLNRRRTKWEVVTGWPSTTGEKQLYEGG